MDEYNTSQILEKFNKLCMSGNTKTYNAINFLKRFYTDKLIPDFFRSQSLKIFSKNNCLKNKVIESATGIDVMKRTLVSKYCYPD